ncbi:MAG: hypothetical protein AB1631_21630 [Acidobacteriota bacterium]
METKLQRDVRFLKAYSVALTLLFVVLIASGFTKNRFDEIDVERINIVEKDGALKMVISNKERVPDPVVSGKTFPRQGEKSPGMIFYNDKGDECGGLVFHGQQKDGRTSAGAALLFDQFNQDQTVGILYSDEGGNRAAGLRVWDRADVPVAEQVEKVQAMRNMKDGPEKTEAMKKFQEAAERGEFGATRVFVGKNRDKSASIVLSDTRGKPRIRMTVDAAGIARLEFLDETGKAIYSLPDSKATEKDAKKE